MDSPSWEVIPLKNSSRLWFFFAEVTEILRISISTRTSSKSTAVGLQSDFCCLLPDDKTLRINKCMKEFRPFFFFFCGISELCDAKLFIMDFNYDSAGIWLTDIPLLAIADSSPSSADV